MSAELQKHIFEPYFTTKQGSQGTGLGLASVYGTVVHHGGALTVSSEPGEGAAFTMYLPVQRTAEQPAPAAVVPVPQGSAKVLLIDDEPAIRLMTTKILTRLGYDVLTANDGQAGVELYETQHDTIDLVLLDMLMPRMNGRDAFYRIRALNPDARVVIVSGYTQDIDIDRMREDGLIGHLAKPYNQRELGDMVTLALAG